jgi:flagellar biosynthesis/type III secretory pathway M-ring protein FliF/YscJ
MELVNKGIAPLVDLFKSMTPAARVTAALLLVVAAVSVTYLFRERATPQVYLMEGEKFSAAQLREMQAALGKAGLEAAIDDSRISVPRSAESRSMAALGEAGALPTKPGPHLEKAVQSGGFLRIPHGQQETAERVAKQQELQSLIDGMRGVEHSAVLIDATDDSGFPRPKKVVTAAVAVWPDHARSLDRDTIQTVRQLLASSVSGLSGDAVTVIDMNTNAHYKGNETPSETGSDYASQKKRHESQWKQTITAVLSYIPGVLVSVNVELNDDAPTVAPKLVTASVNVPRSYLEYVWHKELPQSGGLKSRPDEQSLAEVERRELEKVQRLVGNLLPRDAGSTGQNVAVSTFHSPNESAEVGPALRDQAWSWLLMNWQTASLAGLAIVGLLVLRSMMRATSGDVPASAANLGLPHELSLVSDRFDDGGEELQSYGRHHQTGASLSNELADAVQNDPDAAVSVLRTWIGNAS